MLPTPDDPGRLPAPWWVRDGGLHGLEWELQRELPADHPLYGARVRAAAQCEACDDVLFHVTGRSLPWVVVHLTWSGHQEQFPRPRTTPLAHLDDLLTQHSPHDDISDS
ncbi:hypothetical protein [Streptomyces sp. NRRL F-5755]|uniref:hypothetical protein n=1 Tax=Streptomyces sp. NRRL F-5755 TaxID=1519475 RepID=UPI001331616D|nr:hypothetical protein [Streptomyces sp. NRRL F-5755]